MQDEVLKGVHHKGGGLLQPGQAAVQKADLLIGAAAGLADHPAEELGDGRLLGAVGQGNVDEVQRPVAEPHIDLVQAQHQVLVVEIDPLHLPEEVDALKQQLGKLLPAEDTGEIELQGGVGGYVILDDVVFAPLNRGGRDEHGHRAGGEHFDLLGIKLLLPAQLGQEIAGGSLF